MPTRRRVPALQGRTIDPLRIFRWSTDLTFTQSYFLEDPGFPSRDAAGRAWPRWRRAVWALTTRFQIPDGARAFDHLTFESVTAVRWNWNHVTFDIAPVLEALAEDRANLDRFRQTRAARDVADYLDLLAADLDLVEHTGRALANFEGRFWARPYPQHLSSGRTYGDGK
jgi:hypothetical protein